MLASPHRRRHQVSDRTDGAVSSRPSESIAPASHSRWRCRRRSQIVAALFQPVASPFTAARISSAMRTAASSGFCRAASGRERDHHAVACEVLDRAVVCEHDAPERGVILAQLRP